jgi:hypothetical protein
VPQYEADRLRMGKPVRRACLSKQTTTELVAWLLRAAESSRPASPAAPAGGTNTSGPPVRRRRPSLAVIELPTIRLEMGLQDLGRPNLTPTRAGRADSCGITLGWCSRPAGLAPAAPGGRRGRRPTPPGPGSRAAAGGPAGTPRALDAARRRRGIRRVAATTAAPRPGAGARTRRRHRRRGRLNDPDGRVPPG